MASLAATEWYQAAQQATVARVSIATATKAMAAALETDPQDQGPEWLREAQEAINLAQIEMHLVAKKRKMALNASKFQPQQQRKHNIADQP